MKKPGRKLQKRTMGLLRNLMILGVSFVGLTVVLQLEIEYNLLVLIYALSAVAVLLYQLIRNRSDRDKLDPGGSPEQLPDERRPSRGGCASV